MKLYIRHIKTVVKRNIYGEPVSYDESWVVYKKVWWLFKRYLAVNRYNGNGEVNTDGEKMSWCYTINAFVRFTNLSKATWYGNETFAENLIKDIYDNPNKYILV